MNTPGCLTDLDLIAWWLRESDASATSAAEEHLFACAHCTARLQRLAQFGAGIRLAAQSGAVHAVLSESFLAKLRDDGVRVREYRVQPGMSVACTITAGDDLVVSRLQAELRGAQRIDVVVEEPASGGSQRLHDIAFDAGSGEVVLAANSRQVRQMGVTTLHMRVLALQDGAERELGVYTFNHSPS